MKKLTVIFLLFITVLFFANISNIVFEEAEENIVVSTKFIKVEIGKDGTLKNVYHLVGRPVHFYTYDKDGFDVLDLATPTSYSVNRTNEKITVVFNYENGTKTYVFDKFFNMYTFYVETNFDSDVQVILPVIYTNDTIKKSDNIFVSYRPDKDYTVIAKTEGKLEGNILQGEKSKIKVYIGPYKKLLIKEVFGEEFDKILSTLKTIPGVGKWSTPIVDGLAQFFQWINSLTNNFGVTIIIFTIIVRFIFYPLYHAQTKSMIQMRKLQPIVDNIKKKYKDPQKQQEELMKVYKENKINPAGGCLMLLIQLPIFMLLYSVIQYFQEQFILSPRFLLWTDLSAGGFSENWLFVLISIAASYYLALLQSQDGRTAWQSIIMGALFPFMFVGLPSGIFLYFTANTIIQLVITYYIYKKYKIKGITNRELWGLPAKK